MKTKTISLLSLLLFQVIQAQNTVTGSWLLTKVEVNNKTHFPYFITDFNTDGKMLAFGIELGTWKHVKGTKKLIMHSEFDKDFDGTAKVLQLNSSEMILEKNETNLYYVKINTANVVVQNMQSGLSGTWVLPSEDDETQVVSFLEPDSYKYIRKKSESTETVKGNWLYLGNEHLVVNTLRHQLAGLNQIIKQTDSTLVLENKGTLITLKKETKKVSNIEHLHFTYAHFSGTDESNMLDNWQFSSEMATQLSKIKSMQYRMGSLINNTNLLEYKTLVKQVNVEDDKSAVSIVNLLVRQKDTTQYAENYTDAHSEAYNLFFPESELEVYRVIGQETVTVPAGTFICYVVEGMRRDKMCKFWMLMDKPGVYAKIIEEGKDVFGDLEYNVTELVSLEE